MALLENLDQRETLDQKVSSRAWNAMSASGAAATRICQQACTDLIPGRREKVVLKEALGYFRDGRNSCWASS